MKKRIGFLVIVTIILTLSLAIGLTGCDKKKDKQPPAPAKQWTDIGDALIADEGASVSVKGIVFGNNADGYFISNGTDAILVKTTDTLNVGDSVEVDGAIAVDNKAPAVVATATKVTSSNQTVAPTVGTVQSFTNLTISSRNFYKYVELAGFVEKDGSDYKLEMNGNYVIINTNGKDADFDALIGKKALVRLVNVKFTTAWECAYFGGAEEAKTNLDLVKDEIFTYVTENLVTSVYLALDLPTVYANEPGVEFVWSVVTEGAPLTIVDNVATIGDITQDTTIDLKLTLKTTDKTAEQVYQVVILYAEKKELADFATVTTTPVIMEGKIYVKGTSQTYSSRAVIVGGEPDINGIVNYVPVSVDKNMFSSIEVGNTIKFAGARDANNRIDAQNLIVTNEATDAIDYSQLQYTELKDEESYRSTVANFEENTYKLYKITMPYMCNSGSTGGNFFRFSYSADTVDEVTSNVPDVLNSRTLSLAKNNIDANVPGLQEEILAYNNSRDAVQYKYYSLYAYPMFAGSTTWQFIIPNENAVERDEVVLVKSFIEKALDTDLVIADVPGKINIPQSIPYATDLQWSQDNEFFNLQTGEYGVATNNVTVTLTAKFTANNAPQELSFVINVLKQAPTPKSISEVVANPTVKNYDIVGGTISAIGVTSGNNKTEQRDGLILTDGVNTIWYKTDVYAIDGVALKVGDVVNIINVDTDIKDQNHVLTGGTLKYVSSGNTIDYSGLQVAHTVTNEEELVALAAKLSPDNGHGIVVKFTGDFSLIGTGKSAENCRLQLHFKNPTTVTGSSGARYTFADNNNRTFSFSVAGNNNNVANWLENSGIDISTTGSGVSNTVTGTFYAVACGNGNTMTAWAILPYGFELTERAL